MSIFANAFSNGVWITLGSLLVAGTFALSFILRRENSLPHATSYAAKARLQKLRNAGVKADQQRFIELQERWDLSEILLVAVGAICQQGCARDPSTLASRILYLSLLLMATLVLTAFSAVLTAGVSTQTSTCSSMDKLDERPSVLSLIRYHNQDGNGSVEANFYPNENGSTATTNFTLCAEVRNVSKRSSSENNEPCSSPLESQPAKRAFLRLLKALEVGVARRNIEQDLAEFTSQSLCQQTDEDMTEETLFLSITLTDVWPAIAQLGAGFIISLILFVIEIIVSRACGRGSRKDTNSD